MDSDQVKAIYKHAGQSETNFRLRAMISLARMDVPIMPSELDQDKYLLNALNGTLDLKTGKLLSHCRDNLITKLAPVKYDPDAECPGWTAFLDRIMGGNSGLINFLKQIVGYALTGDTTEQCFFLLYGCGENGKSTFIETIRFLLGDYSQQADFSTFLAKRFDTGGSNDLAALKGARFVSACEANAGRSLNESLVKQLTGGEAVRVRFLYSEFFEFYPMFKLFLATNHRPRIKNQDNAIWRRVKLIPFAVTIPKAEQDSRLLQKLTAETPGILNWALQGCREWLEHGLAEPEEVAEATAEYRAAEDVLGAFLEDRCVLDPAARVNTSDLKKAYASWCEANSEDPVYFKTFADQLETRGCKPIRDWQGRSWKGIELKP